MAQFSEQTLTSCQLAITGGTPVQGIIPVGGNKNAALPMIAAAVLTDKPVVLQHVPDILDVRNMLEIFTTLGGSADYDGETVTLNACNIRQTDIPQELCSRVRTSLLFAGPLTARFNRATVFPPGGDVIGHRRLDTHFHGLNCLGCTVTLQHGQFIFQGCQRADHVDIFLDEPSVTATEHILMTAALGSGTCIIRNAACEPHVSQLARMLVSMGAAIQGIGSNQLIIQSAPQLHGTTETVGSDHIEASSYLALALATTGSLTVTGTFHQDDYIMIRRAFRRLGTDIHVTPNQLSLTVSEPPVIQNDFGGHLPQLGDGPWPQFPSDLMSCLIAAATQCRGNILFFEKMFESRLYFVDHLIAMGATAVVCDPHRVLISGPTPLHAAEIPSPDIRAGMAMVIAACCATGTSHLRNAHVVYRGYADLPRKLTQVGCQVEEITQL